MPQPSRIMSMAGPAIWVALWRRLRRSTSGSFVDKAKEARLHRPREVAQPVAGAFLPARLRRAWRSLFSTLGHPETFRNCFVHWRGPCTGEARAVASVCRRDYLASESGVTAPSIL